ncbi:MAG: DUF6198 family protein [Treponemataceae bacterium]|nr:DUF6198 family protein [Treponemataceae bacterium]
MKKTTFYTEASYAVGLCILALGTACMERADFGMSMIVAPAYILSLKISQVLPFFTFGMAEYCIQALLIVLLSLALRSFKPSYLLSFVTAVIYGLVLDLMLSLVSLIPSAGFTATIAGRALFFGIGMIFGAFGVALLFHTYLAPEAYELVVKEISATYGFSISRVKTIYDLSSFLVSVALSFIFFGFLHFEGIKAGTVICALLNGKLIGLCSTWLEKRFDFTDGIASHGVSSYNETITYSKRTES